MDHETTNENDFRLKSYKLPRGVYEQHEGNTLVWTSDVNFQLYPNFFKNLIFPIY
jgi:hypothetical protein